MNLFKIFDATRKQREQIKAWAAKAGMDGEAIISKVESAFDKDAEQFAAARWLIKGYDESSFKQALYICAQKHIDPMGIDPEELVQKNPDIKPKEKAINPDDVLTDRKDEGDGVVTYAARDEDREVLRQIINTHYGKDASPWCLLQGEDGYLTDDSDSYWGQYNAYPKRVAFKDGKLLAFSAGRNPEVREWWDRMDRSFPFIPYDGKTWLGKNGGTYEIRKGEVYKTEGDTYSRLSKEYSTDIERSSVEASVGSGNDIKVDGGWYKISSQDATHYYVDNGTVKFGVLKDTLQKDGLLERRFHDTLIEKSFYKDGVLHGSYETYYPRTGGLGKRCTYKNGKKDGLCEVYYDDGQLKIKCAYKNDAFDGLYELYHENGQLRMKCVYKDGELNGPYEVYYDDGQLWEKCTYKDEERDGLYELYYANGQLDKKCVFKNGKKNGLCEDYYGNGKLRSRSTYKNDEFDGPYERYDMHGQLIEKGVYKNGHQVE